jgi:hypothetical protein
MVAEKFSTVIDPKNAIKFDEFQGELSKLEEQFKQAEQMTVVAPKKVVITTPTVSILFES